jgi:NAD(P)-dependent dehydrogenase (short-subunit alcohol dehydrogenase family)
MDLGLDQQHVLITGGSKGIGLACARGFLQEGAQVSLVGRNPATLAAARESLTREFPTAKVHTHAADLQDAAQAAAMLEAAEREGGPVHVLVNSAGAARRTPPDDLTPQAWHDAMQAKYFTTIHVLDPLIKLMARRGRGAIVNVVGAGGKVASPIHLPGGAANAALMLVSAGNPGLTLTDRLKEGMAADARLQNITPEEASSRARAKLPLGRMAEPEEIANAVVFLASPRASYITGAILAMDGAVTPMVV